jgi:hypothetical protein
MKNEKILDIILAAVGMGMGIATLVTNWLGSVSVITSISLLSIGMSCLGVLALDKVAK